MNIYNQQKPKKLFLFFVPLLFIYLFVCLFVHLSIYFTMVPWLTTVVYWYNIGLFILLFCLILPPFTVKPAVSASFVPPTSVCSLYGFPPDNMLSTQRDVQHPARTSCMWRSTWFLPPLRHSPSHNSGGRQSAAASQMGRAHVLRN